MLTISDSVSNGKREDLSGPSIAEILKAADYTVESAVVSDEVVAIQSAISKWADSGEIDLIVTTGGTGIALRDVTPEATRAVIDREVPGLAEWMRHEGMRKTPRAVLSRGVTGIRKKCVIVNVPGSPKGAVDSLQSVLPLLPHMIDLLRGNTEHRNSC